MNNLVTIKEIVRQFNISRYCVYEAIKNDPTFPAINVGPNKNYRIDPVDFKLWLQRRPKIHKQTPMFIPSGKDLLTELNL